jgi:DNA-binding NtrC family response regulator
LRHGRELANVVTRLVLVSAGAIEAEDVERELQEAPAARLFSPAFLRSRPLQELREHLEREYLAQLLADVGGDVKPAASRLGISLQALHKCLEAAGLRPKDFRAG